MKNFFSKLFTSVKLETLEELPTAQLELYDIPKIDEDDDSLHKKQRTLLRGNVIARVGKVIDENEHKFLMQEAAKVDISSEVEEIQEKMLSRLS